MNYDDIVRLINEACEYWLMSNGGSSANTQGTSNMLAYFNKLSTFRSFEEFSTSVADGYPEFPDTLIAAVAAEMGEDSIEELDI